MVENKKNLEREKNMRIKGSQKNQFLTFTIKNEGQDLDTYQVAEIIGTRKITNVPDMPNYVKGIINIQGKIIPIIDVRKRYNLNKQEHNYRTCIAVMNIDDTPLGLVVDTVNKGFKPPEARI